jgi:hypothetical protein
MFSALVNILYLVPKGLSNQEGRDGWHMYAKLRIKYGQRRNYPKILV